jgi:hypothetical protein
MSGLVAVKLLTVFGKLWPAALKVTALLNVAVPANVLFPASVGYTPFNVDSNEEVFSPRLTAPFVVLAVNGLLAPTLAIVPGNVCPAANVIGAVNVLAAPSCAYTLFNVVSSADVFNPKPTEPEVPLPVSGLAVVMPVMVPLPVPVPGKVCPDAKLMVPFGAIDRPVAAGVVAPAPNSNSRFAVGDAVLFPESTVCHAKFCGTASLKLLE